MKCSSNVWSACFLTMLVLTAATIPVGGQTLNQPPSPTADQLARQTEYMQKLVAAENIVARDEAALGRKFDVKPRGQIIKNLAAKSLDDILATPVGSSTRAAAIGVGDTTDNLVYFPVPPCRVIDTRVIGAPIAPGVNRIFAVVGGPFDSQGGSATNCNVPWPGPAAAVLNFVAVCSPTGVDGTASCFNPAAGGDLRIFPFGSPVPNASAINYIPQNIVANGIIQTICQGGSCGADITVHADANSTHLVADIVGYFQFPSTPITENLFAVVNAVAAPPTLVATQSFRATSVTRLALGLYLVDFDRSVTNCAYSVTQGDPGVGSAPAGFVGVTGRAGDVNGLFIATYNSAAALTDRSFHVHVMCPPAP